MLELRPSCENCNRPLPPEAREARICSYECTFCRWCVEEILCNVCPNCGGGFEARPVRPTKPWAGNNSLLEHPASTIVKHRPVDALAHAQFAAALRGIVPERR